MLENELLELNGGRWGALTEGWKDTNPSAA